MFNPTSKTWRYFDTERKMMFEKPEGWMPPENIGQDDCLRTSLSYMAYGFQEDKILREGVLSCFTKIPSFRPKDDNEKLIEKMNYEEL
jgi:hypothetical protein